MPVAGKRCEYWQCFTAEGQRKSDEIAKAKAAKKALEACNPPPPEPETTPYQGSPIIRH